jgi:putative tryptophan/tyrosine transport system substrate-binding protein
MLSSARRSAFLLCVMLLTTLRLGGQGDRARAALRITVLQGSAGTASRDMVDGFRRRMEQLGRPSVITVIATDGDAGGPVPRSVGADLVVALGVRAASIAARDYRGTPAIGALVTRESALPDNSVGGSVVLEFSVETELEWMRRLLPQVRRIGVLYSSDENARLVARAREVARGLGLEIVARRVANPAEIPGALSALSGSADALWGISDDVVLTAETAKAMLLASLRSRIPFVGLSSQWARAGAVYALERDYADLGAQTADLAARMLDGGTPRPPEVVRPRKVGYALNIRTADLLRVTISPALVRGAVEVYR